jgi:hypothetical protein
MAWYALIRRRRDEAVKVENPMHIECGEPLDRLMDGRYSCVRCLKVGYLLRGEPHRRSRCVDKGQYVSFHMGGDP